MSHQVAHQISRQMPATTTGRRSRPGRWLGVLAVVVLLPGVAGGAGPGMTRPPWAGAVAQAGADWAELDLLGRRLAAEGRVDRGRRKAPAEGESSSRAEPQDTDPAKAPADPRPAPAPAPPAGPGPAGCGDYSGNRATGCALLVAQGSPVDQMPCLDRLWTRESGWNHLARNSSSGAYGIPQALPGDKMAAYGDDWRSNPATQIRWGLGYIGERYGTPCGAWQFFQSNGWY